MTEHTFSFTEYDRGYLAAMLEADAGIYHEPRRNGKRRATIDFEISNEELAQRVASLLGVDTISYKEAKPRGEINFKRGTYRVRVRGHRASALLASLREDLTEEGRVRVDSVLAATR